MVSIESSHLGSSTFVDSRHFRRRAPPSSISHNRQESLHRAPLRTPIHAYKCRIIDFRRVQRFSASSAFILARLDPSTLVDSGLLRDKISEVKSFRSCRATSGRRLSSSSAIFSVECLHPRSPITVRSRCSEHRFVLQSMRVVAGSSTFVVFGICQRRACSRAHDSIHRFSFTRGCSETKLVK